MSNTRPARAIYTTALTTHTAARAAWGESPTQANYDAMRRAYAALQRAASAEDAAWKAHRAICESRGLVTA